MDRITAFGRVVRKARIAKGLSQEQLAERANLHRNFVSLVERGLSKIALDSLFSLADALEMRTSELIRLTEEEAHKKPNVSR